MIQFIQIVLLSILWAAMTEELSLSNLGIGFVLGYIILFASQHILGGGGFIGKLPRFIAFLIFFAKELVWANFRVAYDIVTPKYHMRPGVLAIPLEARTDLEIACLANLISLTPGTLSLDISTDRKVLYVYTMFVYDHDESVREIKEGLEQRILELLR
jgi:multicomponent Na+:H+ antiporter subunit E